MHPEAADLLVAALPALALSGAGLWWMSRRHEPAHAHDDHPAPAAPFPMHCPANALPVLTADRIIDVTGIAPMLSEVRRLSGLTDPTWQTYVVPVIQAVAEMMQQLPASEAHHHAQPGGLFVHTVETLQHAAKLRQGRILPPGGDIETQGRTQHLWTVGIYVAALLHDIGKTVADVRVTWYSEASPAGQPWQALMGSMIDARAVAYVVHFPGVTERDYQAHQRIGIQLMQRLVSTTTRLWLSSDAVLLEQLLAYLSGTSQGPIAEIVREAEAESVRRNLAAGTRIRFATAKATPLIELLMHALRAMLAEGGRLPLNRPGAAGFCDGTDIWFAAIRLANEVRDWLKTAYPEASVPGETMNDRLFDTWQEYDAARVNPDTQGVIWAARIEFSGGQSIHLGALLRMPLALLYSEPSMYPKPLDGRILSSPAPPEASAGHVPAPSSDGSSSAASTGPVLASNIEATSVVPKEPPAPPAAPVVASVVNREGNPPKPAPSPLEMETPRLPNLQSASAAKKALSKPQSIAAPTAPPPPIPAEFLDDEDAAGTAPLMVGRSPPDATPSEPPMYSGAVVPHVALPKKSRKDAAPSDTALRFMGWVQQGLADGSLPYNTTSALVHFVKANLRDQEEVMMFLVSPAIFRRYAEAYGDCSLAKAPAEGPADGKDEVSASKLGMGIQMAFTQAGWHLPAARNRNIHRLQVMRRGDGGGGSLLNGFLVAAPERFVNPVPPANDLLRYWSQSPGVGADRLEKQA